MAPCDILSPSQSPAKKQRCKEGPQPLSSPIQAEDPRSQILDYNYTDDEDVEEEFYGMHEMTDKEWKENQRQVHESDVRFLPSTLYFLRILPCVLS